ncbi:unnamed protein product [Paramecium octaurelia]|uniref:t-SNARE coiled-coil homology domain-containing protein n=1 Tax=Paramecium octaurelia TaxID=43137 RepID=A0A8S1WQW8_PAROT|nr:unnamed protein product [Paramecium octaurelia]
MTTLDQLDFKLNEQLNKLENDLISLSKKEQNQKTAAINKCQAQVNIISTNIETYKLEICYLYKAENEKYKESLRQILQRFQRLESELQFKKNEVQTLENLFKERSNQQTQKQQDNYSEQVVDMGNQMQEKALKALQNATQAVDDANAIADQINEILDGQINQLDGMYNTVNDTQSVLKRSAEKILYFTKQVQTDKLQICLIGLIFICIIVLIVLSALGLDEGNFNTPDQVKGSLAFESGSVTNTTTTTRSG